MMSLSNSTSEKMRGSLIALLSPIWETIIDFRGASKEAPYLEKINALELENHLLKNEISYLTQLSQIEIDEIDILPARVIYRSPDSWENSIWINKGGEDNGLSEFPILAKNSPVLIGNSVVGVVDYVGKRQSRVRLITDSGLTPSVRAVRGGEQDALIAENIDFMLKILRDSQDKLLSVSEQENLIKSLTQLQVKFHTKKKSWYLAKGEVQGSSSPLWQSKNHVLRGTGFNYDFPDERGEACDLRTGKIVGRTNSQTIPLLKVNDLLMTTGMDGLLPPGLRVALVTRIELLKEGDYCYELEAQPTAGNLNNLSLVFIIPPVMAEDVRLLIK